MTDDITVQILREIRDRIDRTNLGLHELRDRIDDTNAELRGVREDLGQRIDRTNDRLDRSNERLDRLTGHVIGVATEVTEFRTETHRRFDSVLRIVGSHHLDLEARVSRLEDELKLAR
jgi:predicted nuclease with TOPRIM domain